MERQPLRQPLFQEIFRVTAEEQPAMRIDYVPKNSELLVIHHYVGFRKKHYRSLSSSSAMASLTRSSVSASITLLRRTRVFSPASPDIALTKLRRTSQWG